MQEYKLQFGEKWVSFTVPQMVQWVYAAQQRVQYCQDCGKGIKDGRSGSKVGNRKVSQNRRQENHKISCQKCKITRQISGVEYYQYECKTHDLRWLGRRDSKKPSLCEIAEFRRIRDALAAGCKPPASMDSAFTARNGVVAIIDYDTKSGTDA